MFLTETEREAFVTAMRTLGRTELVHYAGASHRDDVAAAMCREWALKPFDTEAELKPRALVRAGWVL